MTEQTEHPEVGSRSTPARPLVAALPALAAAALWVALAVRTPTNTFHFAPVVVALVGPVLGRVRDGTPLARRDAALAAGAGAGLAVAVGVALAATGNLDGPTFWGDGGALVEVVVFAVFGGAIGYRIASRTHDGILF